ncbi:hypothetical protein GGI22_001490, partial [Coemansia erecta]
VALALNGPGAAYNGLSQLAELNARNAKPHHVDSDLPRPHLTPQTSYYNARLNPIRGAPPVQRTAYNNAYDGVPLVEEPGIRVLRQLLYAKQSASAFSGDQATMTVPMTPVSSTISVEQAQACASWSVPSPDSPGFSQPRPATSAEQSAEMSAPHFLQRHCQKQQQQIHQQPQRPATSREVGTTTNGFWTQQRPQTAAQQPGPGKKTQRRHSGWRDIQVKSLARVDSILREAVGLGEGKRKKGGAPSSRWTTYVHSEPRNAGARHNSGLGIIVGHGADPATQNPRPDTAHALLPSQRVARSKSAAPEPAYADQMYSFAAVPRIRRNKSDAGVQMRPSTSNARLGAAIDIPIAYGQRQQQPLTPDGTPTRRRQNRRKSDNRKLSIHIQDGDNANTSSIMMDTSLPARLHTTAPEPAPAPDLAHSSSSSSNGGGARVMSMYMPRDQRLAAVDGPRRQMSMYGAPGRPIQLSRDELRRSRLFAEYELLIASKNADAEAGEEGQYDEAAGIEGVAESSATHSETAPVALNNISEEAEEDEEESTEHSGSRPEAITKANNRKQAEAVDRRVRGVHSVSMYTSADLFSKKQTEKRWSRIINQNQHLFAPQVVAAQLGAGADEHGEEPLLFDIQEVSSSGDENEEESSRRPLVTQSLMLDLPSSADLFADVTQALAERLPPQPPSAGSTASASSVSTFAHRNDQFLLPDMPPPLPPRGKDAGEEQQPSALEQNKDRKGDCRSSLSSLSDESFLSNGSSVAKAEVVGYSSTSSRSSIYIDADGILSSAIFAAGKLPYQQEQLSIGGGTQLLTPQPYAGEAATPTIAARDSSPAKGSEDDGGRRSVESAESNADMNKDSTTKADPNSDYDSATHEHKETAAAAAAAAATDDSGEGSGTRHSEYLRQQLDAVEGRTPATQLGSELSKGDRQNQELLEAYMERFDFHDQPVDFALRQLFQQLHLPSESQQIDRVIASFAHRYDACNAGLFRSADVVYAYAYAILLLHTDAHNPRVRQKISKPQFVARAKLLDEHAASRESEMFDEILDILYENVTMVKFEYAPTDAPSAVGMLLSESTGAVGSAGSRALQSGTSQLFSSPLLTESTKDYHQSPGISGWLRRMFASSNGTHVPAKPALTPLDIPSKEQYSYTAGAKRRLSSIASLSSLPITPTAEAAAASTPHLPEALAVLRPYSSHGTFPRSAAQSRMRANSADHPLVAVQQQPSPSSPATATSPAGLPRISTSPKDVPRIDTSNLHNSAADTLRSVSAVRPFKSSPLAGGDNTSPAADSATGASSSALLQAGSPTSLRTNAIMAHMESSFSPTDIVAPAQPAMVETIRLSSLRGHVKRRVSLRKGRPLSGVIYQQATPPPGHGQKQHQQTEQLKQSFESSVIIGSTIRNAIKGAASSSSAASLEPSENVLLNGNALLRIDMAGRVSRKMERLDNGRRGFVRRWKDVWMVLSGSRLYLFRPNDAAYSELISPTSPDAAQRQAVSIQSIIPLRNGVAVVDAAYKKYPHVFRVLAGDGSEVLVKAPSDDAVAEWMARINCAAAFKTMEVDRRTLASILPDAADASDSTIDPDAAPASGPAPAGSEQRARLLESKAAALDTRLNGIDDDLERNLRLFKQLVSMVPLTRQGRSKTVHYANAVRARLKELYLAEQRLTCYKDVIDLDLAIEYELAGQLSFEPNE